MAQSATDTPTADPEPIALEATAELDYSSDPDRPLTVEVELPGDVDQVEEILFFEIASSSKSRSAAILSTFLWLVVDVVGGGAQSFFLRVMVYRVSTPSPVRVCIPPPSTSTT